MTDETPVDLVDLLSKPMSDFPDRPNLPGGRTFYGKLISITAGNSRLKQTPLFHFAVRLTDPGKDVTAGEMEAIESAGFSLGDYPCGADFYLTPNSRTILRRFLTSLGFSSSNTFLENLKLDEASGLPTEASQEAIRGLDVLIKTPPADDQGRVFLNNVASEGLISGLAEVKKT